MSDLKKIDLLHIGKTGGSAIKYALKDHLETPRYNIKIHMHDVTLGHIPERELIVFFLRDPISRFVSGFYSRRRKGQPRYFFEWSSIEREVFNVFEAPDDLACALSDRSSVNYSLAIKAMKNVQHLRRYRYWYRSMEYIQSRSNDLLYIGFQESLDEDFNKLKQLLDLPDTVQLPEDDFNAHKSSENANEALSERAVNALKEWYKADIEFVAICKKFMTDK